METRPLYRHDRTRSRLFDDIEPEQHDKDDQQDVRRPGQKNLSGRMPLDRRDVLWTAARRMNTLEANSRGQDFYNKCRNDRGVP